METENLAKLVKEYRLKHNLRQIDFARQFNLSLSTLVQIEQGVVRKFHPKTISVLNSILEPKTDVDTSEFNLIARTRLQLGLSQLQLAEISDIAPHVIQALESGKTKNSDLSTLLKLSHTLHLDLEELKKEFRHTYNLDKNLSGGQLIKNVRIQENLSIINLADITGLTRCQLWNIETGKTKKPYLNTLLMLASALDLDPEELKRKFGYE